MIVNDVRSLYEVHFDDGEARQVHTDGRDWAAMEARAFPPGALLTAVRFMAFNAMKREHGYRRSWEQFNGQDCVHIDDITPDRGDDDGEDEQGLDPGPRTTNESAGSTSPSAPGNRSRVKRAS